MASGRSLPPDCAEKHRDHVWVRPTKAAAVVFSRTQRTFNFRRHSDYYDYEYSRQTRIQIKAVTSTSLVPRPHPLKEGKVWSGDMDATRRD